MNNDQNNNNINNTNLNNTNNTNNVQAPIQPTVQPTNPQSSTSQGQGSGQEAIHTKLIKEEKAGPQINMSAYTKVNEKTEKVEKTFTEDPHAGAKRVFGFFLVILIILFAVFLPTISDKVDEYKKKKENENLVNGYLRCKMMKNTDTIRVDYSQNYRFTNNQIINYTYVEEATGSREDANELNSRDSMCRLLDQNTSENSKISVECNINSTSATMKQEINLEGLDKESLASQFSESGGTVPEFSYGDNVDTVQTSLQRTGYTCEKVG